MTDHNDRNRDSRQRLIRAAELVRDDVRIDDVWTASALLAHVAFWDRVALARWQHDPPIAVRIDDQIVDLVNEAALPLWRALSAADAAAQAIAAATSVDEAVARAPVENVTAAMRVSIRFVDRSAHRNEHAEQIERAQR